MKPNQFLYIVLLQAFFVGSIKAQQNKVGINTPNPAETLDVNGKTTSKGLYLRNPGDTSSGGGRFLASYAETEKNTTSLQTYDPESGNSALFNYLLLTLNNVPKQGVTNYDTKIDADNFVVVIHSYDALYNGSSGSVRMALDYIGTEGSNDGKQGSPEFVAYRDSTTNTWHIKARFMNSNMRKLDDPTSSTNNSFNITMSIMVYKKLISKQNINEISKDLGGSAGTGDKLPKPPGF